MLCRTSRVRQLLLHAIRYLRRYDADDQLTSKQMMTRLDVPGWKWLPRLSLALVEQMCYCLVRHDFA